jgi:uncharacterized membrane protein YdbT with pleckstrin-like domain
VSYLDKILQPGEKLLARGKVHWVIFTPSVLGLVAAIMLAIWALLALTQSQQLALAVYVIAGLLALVSIFAFLGRLLLRMTTEFAVTDRRVIVKRGFISLHTVEMHMDKVESVDVDQTIWGRMLGYGTVTIHGTGARWDPIPRIEDPLAFRNAITSH